MLKKLGCDIEDLGTWTLIEDALLKEDGTRIA